MRPWVVVFLVKRSSQAAIGSSGLPAPNVFRRILHNIGPFDPDSRLFTLRGTFGLPLFSIADPDDR